MIAEALGFLNPYRWLMFIIGVVAVVGLLWYGVHSYNVWVSAPLIEAALAKERAEVAPFIANLEATIKARDLTIATTKVASDAERTRQLAKLNTKTIEYKNALLQTKTVQAKYDALLGTSADFERMLHATTANNDSASGTGLSPRFKQLSVAHQQCEREYRAERVEHSKTIGELSKAVAVIEALKN
jgi:hypothetical protein